MRARALLLLLAVSLSRGLAANVRLLHRSDNKFAPLWAWVD